MGWEEINLEGLFDVLDDIDKLEYELRNCVRGAFTNCSTADELSNFVKNLGERLIEEAEYISE